MKEKEKRIQLKSDGQIRIDFGHNIGILLLSLGKFLPKFVFRFKNNTF